MFKQVLSNCPKSVTETTKTHTQKNPNKYLIKKNIYIQKKKERKISNQFLKDGTDSNFNNKSLNRLLNNILFLNFKQLS